MSVQTAGKAYLCTVASTLFNSWALIRLLPHFPTGCSSYAEGAPGSNVRATEVKTEVFSRPSQSFSLTSPEGEDLKWQGGLESGQFGHHCLSFTEKLQVWNQGEFKTQEYLQKHFLCRPCGFSLQIAKCIKFQLIPWNSIELYQIPILSSSIQFHQIQQSI